ncbi:MULTISPECIES: hypothetical protein [Nocardia]|nr:hypothetical protein [Nocardia abscessus]
MNGSHSERCPRHGKPGRQRSSARTRPVRRHPLACGVRAGGGV